MNIRRAVALGIIGCLTAGVCVAGMRSARSEGPAAKRQPFTVRAAVALSDATVDVTETEIAFWTTDGQSESLQSVTKVQHAPNAVMRGDATADLATLYVAVDEARDDFGAVLYRVNAQGNTERLTERAVHAARPMVAAGGMVFIEVGTAGSTSEAGQMRVDELEVLAFAPGSKAPTVVAHASGFALHLAGYTGSGPILYRVTPERAELVVLDLAARTERIVAQIPAFARDFSTDGARLIYSNRSADSADRWQVDQLDLSSGQIATLATTADDAMTPFYTSSRAVAVSGRNRSGLELLGNAHFAGRAPGGRGYDVVEDEAAGLLWVRHQDDQAPDARFLVDPARSVAFRPTLRGQHAELLRMQGSARGGLR